MDEAALIKLILSILDDYVHRDAHLNLKEDYKESHANLKQNIEELKAENRKLLWLLITSLAACTFDLLKGGLLHGGS